ncbi:hypothetical protein Cgig2_033722 [Carnegiea gigantea]|uniref:Alkane hydroxylase MAH1-like n=1 Tax=Carnegiea gigantea TaxID=171969 RepID=A0A9Q1K6X1_9CARY|nr:hypothetical protein Cgig2_033722 [Carnegiea gigantea]
MGYFEIFIALFSLLFLLSYAFRNKNGFPTNWPVVGMLPALVMVLPRIHDYFCEIMEEFQLTFVYEGPWFTNMNVLATVDPANIHHIFSKNFGNYPKGSKFKEIFEVLGDGIFNTDSDLWQYHRKMAQSFIAHPQFHKFLVNKIWEKVETGLIPVLDHASQQGLVIDLQDLFERFTFDTICTIIMDHDPKTLRVDLPDLPSFKALNDIEKAFLHRHAVPVCVWKLQRWLGVGQERKYRQSWEVLDAFIYECLSKKKEEMSKRSASKERKSHNEVGIDLITLYMDEVQQSATFGSNRDKFLRDTFLNFLAAGRDTTSVALSWFFYLLTRNPHVLSKIKEELDSMMIHLKYHHDDGELKRSRLNYLSRNFEELNGKLVYLHGALCEALRLYPPLAFEAKVPIEQEILPSGHKVDPNMQIIISMYAMGRMKSIWGEDSYEFKPERWISETGRIKHQPSYKFFTFNAGPRTCVGKSMAFAQMKAVASSIICNYHIEPVKDHLVIPDISVILHMKHGFKIVVKRSSVHTKLGD